MADRQNPLESMTEIHLDSVPVVAKSTVENARALGKQMSNIMTAVDEAVQAKHDANKADLAKLPADARKRAEAIAQKIANQSRRELTAQVIEKNQEMVKRALGDLQDRIQKLGAASELVGPGPEHLLSTQGLTGSDRSNALFQQVQAAPHATLIALAKRAIAHNDIELGAALALRLSGMETRERPFQPRDLGEKLLGERHAALRKTIDRALGDALDTEKAVGRFLVGRKETSAEKVERGIRARREAAEDKAAA